MALNANETWEVRTTGNDNNGGGFRAGGTGTDFSLQDAAQVVIDNGTITTEITTNVITFTAGYTATSADVHNVVQMLTGTNVTAGFYEITGQTSSTWTVDRNVVTSGTTTDATGNMGGALASPGMAAGAMVVGNDTWIKAGTYSVTTASTNVANGTILSIGGANSANMTFWRGYETTRNDLGAKPLIQASGIGGTFRLWDSANQFIFVQNLAFDCAGLGTSTGLRINAGNYNVVDRVKVVNSTSFGIHNSLAGSNVNSFGNCEVTGASGTAAIDLAHSGRLFNSYAYGNTCHGVRLGDYAVAYFCVSSNNTGAAVDGFSASSSNGIFLLNCTSYANGRAGFYVQNSNGMSYAQNCIAEGNTGVGFQTTGTHQGLRLVNCAGYNNTGGNYNSSQITQVFGFVVGSTTFFVDASTKNFTLNNTAGGGAAARAAGFPGTIPATVGTGYMDIGAFQHQDPVGGGSTIISGGATHMYPAKYNTATDFYVPVLKAASSDFAVSGDWTPGAGDVKVSIDGAGSNNIGTLPTAVVMGNGAMWKFVMTGAELLGKRIVVTIIDAATKAVADQFFEVETYGHELSAHPNWAIPVEIFGSAVTGTLSTTTFTTSLTGYTADQLNRRVLKVLSGAAAGEQVIIVDYAVTNGQVWCAPPLTTALANTDRFTIL